MNIFQDYRNSLFESNCGGTATIHYQTHWTKDPAKRIIHNVRYKSDDQLKEEHQQVFGGIIEKIERDHEYEPKKEKIHANDRPGQLMDSVKEGCGCKHNENDDDEDENKKKKELSESINLVLINRHTGQRVVIKREHVDQYPPREGWQPISSVKNESVEQVETSPRHLATFKTTDPKGNSRHFHVYQQNNKNWYEIQGPVAMHANAVFLNGKIGDFEAEQHANHIANMVGTGNLNHALEYLNRHSTMVWNSDYDQPSVRAYNAPSDYADKTYKMNEQLTDVQTRRMKFQQAQKQKEAEQKRLENTPESKSGCKTLAKEEADRIAQYVNLINQDLQNIRY